MDHLDSYFTFKNTTVFEKLYFFVAKQSESIYIHCFIKNSAVATQKCYCVTALLENEVVKTYPIDSCRNSRLREY